MTQVFVYGTLKKDEIRETILGRKVPAEEDVLSNYNVVPHSVFLIYPTIEKSQGTGTDGYVFDVQDDEIIKLDRYESGLYKKIEVMLDSGTVALTYIENKDLSE
tara:strand:- start:4816 stop:5127 length:312 start_codon:yes stop_codon:yes gene_type:complete